MAPETTAIKYRAFLSYSHRDRVWGKWLHRALEGYRIDKDLVGRQTPVGPVPRSLRPIFRDREDFAAGHSLTEQTLAALEASQFLIVICSPNAAHSKYVNEEIRRFKALGRGDAVIPIIVGGEPGDPQRDCFPPALRFKLGSDGALTDEPEEPIAADAREQGDGKEFAKLKVVAGLLGVGLDDLLRRAQRARKRHIRFWAALAGVFVFLAVFATSSAVYAYRKLLESNERLDQAVEIAYGFVSEATEMSNRFGVPTDMTLALLVRAEAALNGLIAKGANTPTLRYRQALMEMSFADSFEKIGRANEALGRAAIALAALKALTQSNPDNAEWQHALADAYNLYALLNLYQGKLAVALANYRSGLAVIRLLLGKEAKNPQWQAELMWFYSHIGDVLAEQGSSIKALEAYLAGLKSSQDLLRTGGTSGVAVLPWVKLMDSYATLIARWGNRAAALKLLQGSLNVKERMVAADPDSFASQIELRDSHRYIAEVLADQGAFDAALDHVRKAVAINSRVVDADPKFLGVRRFAVVARAESAGILLSQGSADAALTPARAALAEAERIARIDSSANWQLYLSRLHAEIGDILLAQKKLADAVAEYRKALEIVAPLAETGPDRPGWQLQLADARFGIALALQMQGSTAQATADFNGSLAIYDRLSAIDRPIVVYRFAALEARWHLAECAAAPAATFAAVLTDLRALDGENKLSFQQKKMLADAEKEFAALPTH